MPDVLDGTRKEITRRLIELEPVVSEYNRLLAAEQALADLDGSPRQATGRKAGRPRANAPKATAQASAVTRRKRRTTRTKRSGGRAAEALALVQTQPGITIPELATKMRIQQNYLYRVMPSLQKDGKVTKRGKGWHPTQ